MTSVVKLFFYGTVLIISAYQEKCRSMRPYVPLPSLPCEVVVQSATTVQEGCCCVSERTYVAWYSEFLSHQSHMIN